MNRQYLQSRFLPILFLGACTVASAQQSPAPSSSLSLEQISMRAGLIFSGTVQEFHAEGDSVTRVKFQVEEGIRGTQPGDTVTVREWTGSLRTGGSARYRVGEKVLVFFHSAAPNGLTSPVGGSAGVVRFSDPETLKLTDDQSRALARSPRLRTMAPVASGTGNLKSLPAAEFFRALRLVSSQ